MGDDRAKAGEDVGRARAGGEIGRNGYRYGGGQFLPSTDLPPGTWRVGKAIVRARREEIENYKREQQPSPYARSIYALCGPGATTIMQDGKLVPNEGYIAQGPMRGERSWQLANLDIKGVTRSIDALCEAFNSGKRWIDITTGETYATAAEFPQYQDTNMPKQQQDGPSASGSDPYARLISAATEALNRTDAMAKTMPIGRTWRTELREALDEIASGQAAWRQKVEADAKAIWEKQLHEAADSGSTSPHNQVVASLEELSSWMRTHTGAQDGTNDMLVRAVKALEGVGRTVDQADQAAPVAEVPTSKNPSSPRPVPAYPMPDDMGDPTLPDLILEELRSGDPKGARQYLFNHRGRTVHGVADLAVEVERRLADDPAEIRYAWDHYVLAAGPVKSKGPEAEAEDASPHLREVRERFDRAYDAYRAAPRDTPSFIDGLGKRLSAEGLSLHPSDDGDRISDDRSSGDASYWLFEVSRRWSVTGHVRVQIHMDQTLMAESNKLAQQIHAKYGPDFLPPALVELRDRTIAKEGAPAGDPNRWSTAMMAFYLLRSSRTQDDIRSAAKLEPLSTENQAPARAPVRGR